MPSSPLRATGPVRRLSRFTRGALVLSADGPPWHRGLVAVANFAAALALGHHLDTWMLGALFALLLTLSDVEGPLGRRLSALAWCAPAVALGVALGLALAHHPAGFALTFLAVSMVAGVAAWAGAPFTQAGRYALVGMLVVAGRAPPAGTTFALLAAVTAIAALTRTVESRVAPDAREGECVTLAEARARLGAAGPRAARFVAAYGGLAAAGWLGGRAVDAAHPTWIAVTALMVMWPDRRRTHERVVQRAFGTAAGALVGVALLHLVRDPTALLLVASALMFFAPHFVRRNYWLHSGLVAVFVLLASASSRPAAVAWARVADVLVGCALAGVGTLAAFPRARRTHEPEGDVAA